LSLIFFPGKKIQISSMLFLVKAIIEPDYSPPPEVDRRERDLL
jgi:hypothetical protein